MNTTIVNRIREDGINIDIYSDGDWILDIQKPGYVQIKAGLLAKYCSPVRQARDIELKAKPVVQESNPAVELIVVKAEAPELVSLPAVEQDGLAQELPFTRKVVKGDDGWDCTFTDRNDSSHICTFVYASRSLARSGLPSDEVNARGRIR